VLCLNVKEPGAGLGTRPHAIMAMRARACAMPEREGARRWAGHSPPRNHGDAGKGVCYA
jgi:hypothetical protein